MEKESDRPAAMRLSKQELYQPQVSHREKLLIQRFHQVLGFYRLTPLAAYEPLRQSDARKRARNERRHSGGDSVRVPPLPIPNREVKPHRADGTAKVGE